MDSKFISPLRGELSVPVKQGKGIYLYDEAGKRYLDGSSGAMTVSLGHNNQEITRAIEKQLELLAFSYRSQFTNEPLEKLCKEIAALAPGDLDYVSFANSGSEAAELALKLAYSYWTACGKPMKQRILSRWSSYHGSTLGALSMTGNASRRKEYSPYLRDYPVLELPFCRHCPYEKEPSSCGLFCAEYMSKLISRYGAENISAFICEPITGASGAGITPPDGYFQRIREICDENGILLIFDEVITGFGRTGKLFAAEHWGIVPDVIVFGKGITSGYIPMSGIIVRKSLYEAMAEKGVLFTTGHTFSGNPLAAASAMGVLGYMKKNNTVEQAAEKGAILAEKLKAMMERCRIVSDIRGKGLLYGVEIAKSPEGREFFPAEERMTEKLVRACFDQGLIVYPSAGYIDGVLGDSVLVSPPLIITEEEIDLLVRLLEASIHAVEEEVKTKIQA